MNGKPVAGPLAVALLLCFGTWQDACAMERVQLGPAPKVYAHTFELPQYGRNWRLYVPGAAYQTENRVEGTR